MVYVEYDCSGSEAIERIAYDKIAKKLAVIFRKKRKNTTYVYLEVFPSIEKKLQDPNYNKGKLVNEIKRSVEFQEYRSFPSDTRMFQPGQTNNARQNDNTSHTEQNGRSLNQSNSRNRTRNRRKEFVDYSTEWLQLLDEPSVRKNREFLESLLLLLVGKYNSHYFISIPPPPFDLPYDGNETFNANTAVNKMEKAFSSTNFFSNLAEDDDESDEELIRLTNRLGLNSEMSSEPKIIIQSRYLRVRVIMLIAECIRGLAIRAQKEHAEDKTLKYQNIWANWTQVYELLKNTCFEIADWFLFYYQIDELEVLPNFHSKQQLKELLDSFLLLQEHTEGEKNKALSHLERRRDTLNRKLNPMLRERDEIKQKVGERRWRENPDPKFDYALKRKEWEDELTLVETTMEILNNLLIYR